MTTLEERVAAIEARLNMESGLRASADQDLADMAAAVRSQRALIQAVAITQSEHSQILDRHSQALVRLQSGVQEIIRMLDRLAPTEQRDE